MKSSSRQDAKTRSLQLKAGDGEPQRRKERREDRKGEFLLMEKRNKPRRRKGHGEERQCSAGFQPARAKEKFLWENVKRSFPFPTAGWKPALRGLISPCPLRLRGLIVFFSALFASLRFKIGSENLAQIADTLAFNSMFGVRCSMFDVPAPIPA